MIYVFRKGYVLAKLKKSGIAFSLTNRECNAVLLRIEAYLKENIFFKRYSWIEKFTFAENGQDSVKISDKLR